MRSRQVMLITGTKILHVKIAKGYTPYHFQRGDSAKAQRVSFAGHTFVHIRPTEISLQDI